ncbi:MAG: hypothetical protein Q9M97_05620 [Candidatus Gracilibacteria bacterium]|nr:hypothetical protein [Candidatus Gracilibacteria bacterium]
MENKIENFILIYRNAFLVLFSDTGIYDEEIIIQNYIDSSNNFHKEILNDIDEKLSLDEISGYKVLNKNKKGIYFKLISYLVFIEYIEKDNLRIIKDIEFNKKID